MPQNFVKRLRFGVRQRVVLTLFGGLVVSLSISSWLILAEQKSTLENEINRHGKQAIEILSLSLSDKVIGYDYHGIQLFLDDAVNSTEIKYVKVLSDKGNTMAETDVSMLEREKLKYFQGNILVYDEITGQVIIGIDVAELTRKLELHQVSLINREVVIILFIIFLEYVALSFLIVYPLSKISNVLKNNVADDGVLTSDIEIKSHDEFGDIARQFNDMRSKLNKAHYALQGKFLSADEQLKKANSELIKKSRMLEEINKELQHQTLKDPLSGLFNRRKFQDLLENEVMENINDKNQFLVMVVDIDHFKSINDIYGHSQGDSVIKYVAKRISNCIRSNDIVCRIGGEEFFLFMHGANLQQAEMLGEKIRKTISDAMFHSDNEEISITVSIGIAGPDYNDPLESGDSLYSKADSALYYSKENGRNRISVHNSIKTQCEIEG